MLKKVPLRKALGSALAHDITEIRPGEFKGPAFRKGHVVREEDMCHLQRLGKNHLYILELKPGQIHEDEAAILLARAIAAEGVQWAGPPREGKIELTASRDGLLRVQTSALAALNAIEEVMCATLHTHTLVRKGDTVAATRAIPLVMERRCIEEAAGVARLAGGIVAVHALRAARTGLIITGDEVYHGLVQDRFEALLREKMALLGSSVEAVALAPDDARRIAVAIRRQIQDGCDLLLVTGGMSVDPDDVTRQAVRLAGARQMHYGAAALPGAMFLAAYVGEIPLLGVPACGLYHRTTVLDLVLPRVLAGERIDKAALALLGHGGLCRNCPVCDYPRCGFGKG